jgi:hypothetical protein
VVPSGRAGVPARHSLLSLLSKWRAGTPALLLECLQERFKPVVDSCKACPSGFYILQEEKVTKAP